MIDIQTRKLKFIEEYVRLTDEVIIEKLAQLLKKEKQKALQSKKLSMTNEELEAKLERSEADIKESRLYSQEEVEDYFKNKRQK